MICILRLSHSRLRFTANDAQSSIGLIFPLICFAKKPLVSKAYTWWIAKTVLGNRHFFADLPDNVWTIGIFPLAFPDFKIGHTAARAGPGPCPCPGASLALAGWLWQGPFTQIHNVALLHNPHNVAAEGIPSLMLSIKYIKLIMILSNISGDWWTFFLLIRQLWCTIEEIFSEVDWQFSELSSHVGSELYFWISGWDQRCVLTYSPMQKTLCSDETLSAASFSLLPILCVNCKSPCILPSLFGGMCAGLLELCSSGIAFECWYCITNL